MNSDIFRRMAKRLGRQVGGEAVNYDCLAGVFDMLAEELDAETPEAPADTSVKAAIARTAKDLHDQVEIDDCDVPVLRIELATLLSDIAQFATTGAETQPATPNVREACEALASLVDITTVKQIGHWRHRDTAIRLATEARTALAAEAETPRIVAMLLAECERMERWLAFEIKGREHASDPWANTLRALQVVIATAKGQSNG